MPLAVLSKSLEVLLHFNNEQERGGGKRDYTMALVATTTILTVRQTGTTSKPSKAFEFIENFVKGGEEGCSEGLRNLTPVPPTAPPEASPLRSRFRDKATYR